MIIGKIAAVRYARENRIPFLGICFGMQFSVIEFARHVAGLEGLLVDHRTASSVDQEGLRPHFLEFGRTDYFSCLIGQWQDQTDEIGFG